LITFGFLLPRREPGPLPPYDLAALVRQVALVALVSNPMLVVLVARRQGPSTVLLQRRAATLQLAATVVLVMIASVGAVALGVTIRFGTPQLLRFPGFLAVAVQEELSYHGFLQTRLVAWLGDWRGWLVAGAIFGLSHVPGDVLLSGLGAADVTVALAQQTAGGLLNGWIVLRLRAIAPVIVFHAAGDWYGWLSGS
jgi:membrane protease YdiL (CAAX protease family)